MYLQRTWSDNLLCVPMQEKRRENKNKDILVYLNALLYYILPRRNGSCTCFYHATGPRGCLDELNSDRMKCWPKAKYKCDDAVPTNPKTMTSLIPFSVTISHHCLQMVRLCAVWRVGFVVWSRQTLLQRIVSAHCLSLQPKNRIPCGISNSCFRGWIGTAEALIDSIGRPFS